MSHRHCSYQASSIQQKIIFLFRRKGKLSTTEHVSKEQLKVQCSRLIFIAAFLISQEQNKDKFYQSDLKFSHNDRPFFSLATTGCFIKITKDKYCIHIQASGYFMVIYNEIEPNMIFTLYVIFWGTHEHILQRNLC